MASAGHFVRERIPVPCNVPEAGRLIMELVSSSRDSEIEHEGPMTFNIVRKYRPSWATATGFLVFPLFVRTSEVCRAAVIEAKVGAELLLEGVLDPDLHASFMHLGRVPEAARVSTLNPRPVPQALAPHPPQAASAPIAERKDSPDLIDLRTEPRREQVDERDDEFANLIPPPLLGQPTPAPRSAPAGPAPSFQPLTARASEHAGNGNGRLPSAFRSGRDPEQPDIFENWDEDRPNGNGHGRPADRPARSSNPFGPPTVAHLTRPSPPSAVRVTIDSGEQTSVEKLLIIGRAPTAKAEDSGAVLLAVNDPSLSVSKTHVAVELRGNEIYITDRNSTNGTWIDEGRGALRPVPPNEPTLVPVGARVLIGERVLTFTR